MLQLAEIERTAVHEIELGTRHARSLRNLFERRTILLGETEDQIAPALHLFESRWVQIDAATIFVQLARELLERVERAVVELLEPLEGRVDTLNCGQLPLH